MFFPALQKLEISIRRAEFRRSGCGRSMSISGSSISIISSSMSILSSSMSISGSSSGAETCLLQFSPKLNPGQLFQPYICF